MFKWFRKNERGSVMVIVAIALTSLLGFTGLAVDFGTLAMTRQELQNAADAAALAAGQDKLHGRGVSAQTDTANAYIIANGYTPGDGVTTSQVVSSGSTVRVTITTQRNVGFSSILTGRKSEEVSATAVAEVMNPFENYPYAMFAGDTIEDDGTGITGNGNKFTITGNIHSNTDITLHKDTVLNGVATAVGSINGTYGGHPMIPMPSAQSIINYIKSNGCAYFNGDVDIKKNDAKEYSSGFEKFIADALDPEIGGGHIANGALNIYISGNLTIRGDEFHNSSYPLNLVVSGNIDLGGSPLTSTEATPVIMISEHGSVEVNGQGTTGGAFYGIVFAENGDVTLNGGNNSEYIGSIYALNIRKNGSPLDVGYSDKVDDHLILDKVRLIE
ncbi:MAG: hypothetical protein IJO21_02345 [Oscillospiraceae bacterium]|nr:hypothetical protein [Oscillospiraceae bacterium]